jgi:hypothetical protein
MYSHPGEGSVVACVYATYLFLSYVEVTVQDFQKRVSSHVTRFLEQPKFGRILEI